MSRICMLNPFFYPYQGGTEKHVREVGKRLAKKGFDITVLCNRMKGDKKTADFEGMHIKRVDSLFVITSVPPFVPLPPPIAITPAMNSAIKKELRSHDLFHIHNRFVYSPSDAKAVKDAGKRLCLTLHNARTKGISPAVDFLGSIYDETNGHQIMEQCDHILAVSQNTIDTTVPPELGFLASVAYNGVDTKVFNPSVDGASMRKKYGLDGKKVVLTVCRLEPQKGLLHLARAMRHLVRKDHSYVWVLVGTGSQQTVFETLAKAKAFSKNFVFIGEKIKEAEVAQIYAAADLFALPSVWEPFGIVVCEALASGKPVVTTTAGGLPEIVDSNCGLLVPPKSAHALELAIDRMFESPKMMRKMGRAGRELVCRKFTWDKTAAAYQKLYDNLL